MAPVEGPVGRLLRYLGLVLLSLTASLLLADALAWVEAESIDPWIRHSARAGIASLGAGVLLGLLSPVGRTLRRGHCARCGAPIERGQTYCLDHLQAAVNEYKDQARSGKLKRPGFEA